MMEAVRSLEKAIAGVHKDMPHLPPKAHDWLVLNAWWIVLLGVVLSAFGLISAFSFLLSLSAAISTGGLGVVYPGFIAVSTTGLWISLVIGAIQIVLEAMAINPLKAQLRKGWDLLFVSSLLGVAAGFASLLFGNFFGVFGLAFGLIIGWYLLFEVRDGFDGITITDATPPSSHTTQEPKKDP